MAGETPRRCIPAAYRSAKIMISPALGMESFGIVLIEAMACGVPVVASDIPGYRAVVEDGVQGMLFPPGDAPGPGPTRCCDSSRTERRGRGMAAAALH